MPETGQAVYADSFVVLVIIGCVVFVGITFLLWLIEKANEKTGWFDDE